MYLFLTLLIIIFIILIFKKSSIENFNASPYNSFEVNKNEIEIHESMNEMKNLYIKYVQTIWNPNNWDTKYMISKNKINANIFVFKDFFRKIITRTLNNKFPDKTIEVSEIENIGWYNQDNSIIFDFDVNIINRKELWIIPIKAWIKLKSDKICLDIKDCIDIISKKIDDNVIGMEDIESDFELVFVLIDNLQKYDVKPVEYIDNYYQIKNILFLTDPFLTSGEEMRLKNIE